MNNNVQVKVKEQIQKEAAIVLAKMGLTVSDACSMLLTRIACEKILPFELLIPNEQTLKAIGAARGGKFAVTCNLDNLLN